MTLTSISRTFALSFGLLLASHSVQAAVNPMMLDAYAQDFQQGLQAYQNKQWEQAYDIWMQLQQQQDLPPELKRALNNNIGSVLLQQGKVEEAAQYLERALRADEQLATTLDNLQRIYAYKAQSAYKKVFDKTDVVKPQAEVLYFNTENVIAKTPGVVIEPPVLVAKAEPKPELKPAKKVVDEESLESKTVAVLDKPAPKPTSKIETPKVVEQLTKEVAQDENSDQLLSTVEGWRQAWSDQDLAAYLSFYHPTDFKPVKGRNIKEWRKGRKSSVEGPKFIKVQTKDVKVVKRSDERATVSFLQQYHSNRFKDNIRKELQFVKTDQGWKIISEQVKHAKR